MLDNEIVVSRLGDLAHIDEGKIFKNTGIGVVKERGSKKGEVAIGDKIAWIGIPTADEILVPENLFKTIPEDLDDSTAVFTGITAFIIQAVRESELTFGEKAVVLGEGILKQLISQVIASFGIQFMELDFSNANETDIDGVFICPGSEVDVNSLTGWLRNQATVIVLTEKPLELSPMLLQEKKLRLVFPKQPQPEKSNVHHPTAYKRWTIKKDLELSLKLLRKKAIAAEVKVEI